MVCLSLVIKCQRLERDRAYASAIQTTLLFLEFFNGSPKIVQRFIISYKKTFIQLIWKLLQRHKKKDILETVYDGIISDSVPMFVSRYGTCLKVQRHERLFFVAVHETTRYKALGNVQKSKGMVIILRNPKMLMQSTNCLYLLYSHNYYRAFLRHLLYCIIIFF
jgi:hypothetical protein